MIYIATVHWKQEDWINIQLKYLKKHIKEPHKIYTCIHGIENDHSQKFSFASTYNNESLMINRNHADKLNFLASKIIEDSEDENDLIIFIDSDAFPINNFLSFIREKISDHKLIAARRDENNGDKQPHPLFCATTIGFWKQINGDWNPGPWINNQGEKTSDIGGKLLQKLKEKNINWYPLLKTDKAKYHPVWFGIYGNIIYHNGAGSRESLCRQDKLNKSKSREQIIRDSQKLMDNMLDKIKTDEFFYEDL